jgi:hypothetical protein
MQSPVIILFQDIVWIAILLLLLLCKRIAKIIYIESRTSSVNRVTQSKLLAAKEMDKLKLTSISIELAMKKFTHNGLMFL